MCVFIRTQKYSSFPDLCRCTKCPISSSQWISIRLSSVFTVSYCNINSFAQADWAVQKPCQLPVQPAVLSMDGSTHLLATLALFALLLPRGELIYEHYIRLWSSSDGFMSTPYHYSNAVVSLHIIMLEQFLTSVVLGM